MLALKAGSKSNNFVTKASAVATTVRTSGSSFQQVHTVIGSVRRGRGGERVGRGGWTCGWGGGE